APIPAQQGAGSGFSAPAAQPSGQPPAAVEPSYRGGAEREQFEVNIGATTESNFFVGFSGEIAEGGVFAATYNIFPKGTRVNALVTLPGGFEKHVLGTVRFVRDPMDMNAESEPGMGIQFESLDQQARELILRFIRKRAPMFYDD
nr:PilZ domain-containing protein [Myxococcota bacterium]